MHRISAKFWKTNFKGTERQSMFNRNSFMYCLLYYSRELMKKYMFWLLAQGKK